MSDSDSEPVDINQSPRQGRRHGRLQDRVRALPRRAPKWKWGPNPTPCLRRMPTRQAALSLILQFHSHLNLRFRHQTRRPLDMNQLIEKMQKWNKYFAEHTFSDLKEAFAWIALQDKVEAAAVTDVPSVMDAPPAEVEPSSQLPLLEPEDQPLQALGQESKVPQLSESHHSLSESPPQCEKSVNESPKKKISVEEIVQNGKKWMSEEVMLAFQKYIEKRDDFEGLEYCLEELRYQCFSVESYRKTFHHYNFVVKMNKPSSADSTLILYFAEVKEMFGNKFYFCCPLESDDDGHCDGYKDQGMYDLKHPDEGGYQSNMPPDVGCHLACLCMEEGYNEDDDEYDILVSHRKVDEDGMPVCIDDCDDCEVDIFDLLANYHMSSNPN